jgi:hypothetical protein
MFTASVLATFSLAILFLATVRRFPHLAGGVQLTLLDPTLRAGNELPRWQPRSRRGAFMGLSPIHSSEVPLVLRPHDWQHHLTIPCWNSVLCILVKFLLVRNLMTGSICTSAIPCCFLTTGFLHCHFGREGAGPSSLLGKTCVLRIQPQFQLTPYQDPKLDGTWKMTG